MTVNNCTFYFILPVYQGTVKGDFGGNFVGMRLMQQGREGTIEKGRTLHRHDHTERQEKELFCH